MSGLWLASYLVLWGLFLLVCLFLIGILRQLGLLQRQLQFGTSKVQGESAFPSLENDGPAIGSSIPSIEADTMNGFGDVTSAILREPASTMLVFMSPMCETCQHVVEPLNALVAEVVRPVRPIVVIRADEQACRAFLSVFPLHMPVVCDSDRTIPMGLDVHRPPFGLLYDEHGILIRKGLIERHEDLLALLGDGSAPERAQANIFPPVVSSFSA